MSLLPQISESVCDTLDNSLNLVEDTTETVRHVILGTTGHITGTLTFEPTDTGFLLGGVIRLLLLHLLRDLHELLTSLLPVLNVVITTVVTQLYGEFLQLIDGSLLCRT